MISCWRASRILQVRTFFWGRKYPRRVIKASQPAAFINENIWRHNIVQPWLFHEPSPWSTINQVPVDVECPPYGNGGDVKSPIMQSDLDSPERIAGIRKACKLARTVLDFAGSQIKVGLTTSELDNLVFTFIIQNKAYPSPLGYRHYPKSICTSVNNVVCHGIPDSRPLMEGDIINVDITVFTGGYHGDCSETFGVGNIDDDAKKLIEVNQLVLDEAISICRNRQKLSEIGEVIETIASQFGYSVNPYFCGHGIGPEFHMFPDIIHRANTDQEVMKTGMVFTIEPILSEGSDQIIVLDDGWTAISADNSRSAQFEHTILIQEDHAEVLTFK